MIVGPSTFNFEEAAARAVEAGAARRVADAAAAVEAALALLAAPDLAERMGRAGLAFAAEHRGATERTMTGLAELRARL
jgi:3-deoxy-D-manno-octulosonic-acid transferase